MVKIQMETPSNYLALELGVDDRNITADRCIPHIYHSLTKRLRSIRDRACSPYLQTWR